jgi:hypothetical protein
MQKKAVWVCVVWKARCGGVEVVARAPCLTLLAPCTCNSFHSTRHEISEHVEHIPRCYCTLL